MIQLKHSRQVLLEHGSNNTNEASSLLVRKTVPLLEVLHGHVVGLVGVLNLYQFLAIDEPVEIKRSREGSGHRVSRSVVGLGEPMEALPSHHFLDHLLSKSLLSQLFVDSQEVDLHDLDSLAADDNLARAADNGGHDLLVLRIPYQEVAVLDEPWSSDGPAELLLLVEQAEVVVFIFYVVLLEELAYFLGFGVDCHVERGPLEARRQRNRLLRHIFNREFLNLSFLGGRLVRERDSLGFPEFMLSQELQHVLVAVSIMEMYLLILR
mmetsp:Transcript_32914/g.50322  ORF Transcript_32914/g.50322 Transcript_32914/m.50322 type:complete len:266 (-) Transcript_32914:230-1027(-)